MTSVYIATQTLIKIETMCAADQGSLFRHYLGKVIPHIGDAYREGDEGHRSHMGASLIGGECARAIYLNHRWVTRSAHEGRIVRLFNRGHLEEARFIALLLMIGCQLYQQDEKGNQFRVNHANGHFGGSGDGVALGIPDLQLEQYGLTEFKTSGDSGFNELAGKNWKDYVKGLLGTGPRCNFEGKGVQACKFEHYVQMNIYMHKMGIGVALYMVVNKNTDSLYAELVPYDREIAERYLDRADTLVWLGKPPKRISESPGFYKCKFCDHRPTCHDLPGKVIDRNCRTCEFSEPIVGDDTGQWNCKLRSAMLSEGSVVVIPKDLQLTGCDQYCVRDDL